jgi:hypothetical protein
MYIISLIIIIILVTLYQSIYKYCEQIKIYKNQYRKKNINVLIIGGTHGNEPAGTHTLINFKKKIYDYPNINLTIIPEANKCGLKLNTRYLPHRLYDRDLNRNYKDNSEYNIESVIYKEVIKNDIIIDLHEGYSFHKLNENSVGQTIYCNNPSLKGICNNTVNNINKNIKEHHVKFTCLNNLKIIKNSMRDICDKLNKTYFLIETAGQNDIQSLNIRVRQQLYIIDSILSDI